jgi:hypothetical protein
MSSQTYEMDMTYTVKEDADGKPWVALEFLDDADRPEKDLEHFGIRLKEGQSHEDAQRLAHLLRRSAECFTATVNEKAGGC